MGTQLWNSSTISTNVKYLETSTRLYFQKTEYTLKPEGLFETPYFFNFEFLSVPFYLNKTNIKSGCRILLFLKTPCLFIIFHNFLIKFRLTILKDVADMDLKNLGSPAKHHSNMHDTMLTYLRQHGDSEREMDILITNFLSWVLEYSQCNQTQKSYWLKYTLIIWTCICVQRSINTFYVCIYVK